LSLARKVYYSLPPSLRYVARYLVYTPIDLLDTVTGQRNKNIPPKRLIYTGGGDFLAIGKKIVDHIRQHHLITPSSNVLDIGSGLGRIALPLTEHITDGKYEGFDIIKSGVRWCQKNISTRYPNFNFKWVQLVNDLYTNKGENANQFVFPYKDNEFDLAIAISVFTHMVPDEVENYITEIQRVLKPGGSCYLTFFILNADSTEAMQASDEFNFKFNHDHYALLDEKVKSANVAYKEQYLQIR
jgi:ubiquinone/menaquinone biosynthesis C-methylase UbiE